MVAVLLGGFVAISAANAGDAGSLPATVNDYKILAPITHGDLTIFPVVSARSHDTSDFGGRSGKPHDKLDQIDSRRVAPVLI